MATTVVKWRKHPEMAAFMEEIIPGRTESEIRAAFLERFGIELTEGQIGNFKTNHGIRSGTHGGRFEKGHESWNKGRPQSEWMSAESIERSKATRFKRGELPHNTREVGEERVTKDGYVQVHVRQHRKDKLNDQWVLKQRLVWERHHGRPVPPGCKVVFCDGDQTNFDPDNLLLVTDEEMMRMNHGGTGWVDRETAEAARDLARVRSAIAGAQRRYREGRSE